MTLNPIKSLLAKLPPMPTAPPTHEPHRATLLQLAALIFIAVLLHFRIADPKIALFAVFVFSLKALIVFRRLKPPPKLIMVIMTIASLGMVLFIYGGWNGQTAGISFLVLLVTLKFLESDALRDYFVVCLLLYFLAASSFLFDSSIVSISIIVIYTLGITSILFQISNPTKVGFRQTLKSSFGMVIKALPLAVLLFFFFPRISGDFGFLPSSDQRFTDGLSDSLVAGDLAASAFNNELAFRVEFKNDKVPPRSSLYWRAKTMSKEFNFAWEVAQPEAFSNPTLKEINAAASLENGEWSYKILHEKSSDNFIPYLDYVAGVSKGFILRDYSVTRRRKDNGPFRYEGSASSKQLLNTGLQDPRQFLQTRSKPTARLDAVLTSIRNKSSTKSEAVNALYQLFLDQPFKYSLTPPGLNEFTPLDDFIFNTRTGYCEHYASAFTTLARWLDVPARIVTGYQGGTEVNGGKFLEIKYSDAHAWSEVWLEDQWVRVDATAAVSPERIEYGMEALQELWGTDFFSSNASGRALADFLNPSRAQRVLRQLQDSWKNIGYQWNKWVVDYNIDTQRELLENLGFKHKNSILTLVLIMALGALTMMLLYFWQLVPKRIKRNELQTIYLSFIGKFKRHGLEKSLSDTPESFAAKARSKFPHASEQISEVCKQYQALRYGLNANDGKTELDTFKRKVKQFKLNPK